MHSLVLFANLLIGAALPDRGIFPEFDNAVDITLPPALGKEHTWLRVDGKHQLVTLYDGEQPLKAYPAKLPAAPRFANVNEVDIVHSLAPADATELAAALAPDARVVCGAPTRKDDVDGDGIVNQLDITLGARKLTVNKARYFERYVGIKYPGGDVPRTEGVCTDTVIRSLRNAGIDLQKEVHEDIVAHPAAYPMVEKVDASINHRRVKTVVRWFERHWKRLPDGAPFRAGDIAFFDTFPSKDGPEHLGVVSDRYAANGKPLVINNWTDGYTDGELELLSWVPVTHHFRAP